jgi:copper oxidase (laccase) domain-containing protein
VAVLGPSISHSGYQVGAEVAAHFAHVPDALVADGERYRLDLTTVALQQLADRVDDIVTVSTRSDLDPLLFSDRAQRPCGRHALVARWRPTMDAS